MAMARSRPAIEDSPPSLDAPFGVLRVRLARGRRRRISTGPRRLHFGCFDRPRDGWLNTDITPHVLISRIPCLPRLLHALGRMDDRRLAQHQSGVFRKVERLDVTRRFPFRDGEFEAIRHADVSAEYEDNGLYHRSVTARIETAAGEKHVITGDVKGFIPLRNRREGLVTHIGEGMTEWKWGDRTGYGLSEFLKQVE